MKKENPLIQCACGCGEKLHLYDNHYRTRKYISGHNGRKYKDRTQYKKEWRNRNKEHLYTYKMKRLRKIKSDMILEAGGQCLHCTLKYNSKNAAVFDFHHRDESTKLFTLNQKYINQKNKAEIKLEFLKCDLLCANCHRIHHSSEY